MDRNQYLMMDDEALSRICQLDFFKGSGNGGQKRNKTSSAVRVKLTDLDLTAEDCSGRSQHQNRHQALKKLRRKIAYSIRENNLNSNLNFNISESNPAYYLYLAELLDVFFAFQYNLKNTAQFFNLNPNKLDKIIKKDTSLYQQILHHPVVE